MWAHKIYQYKWTFKKEVEINRKEEKTTMSAEAAMNPDDYTMARGRMLGASFGDQGIEDATYPAEDSAGKPRKGKTPEQKEADTKEKERQRAELERE
eukprot:6323232-Pyramimonas_sp.AAC.1